MNIITTTKALEAACDELLQNAYVAVDTEFMRETVYWPQLCLIQAAAGKTEVIIDPLAEELDLEPFWELMADERITKVFHAARQDLEIFFHRGGDSLIPHPMFDSQVAAMALGLGDSIAYDALVKALLKRPIDKGPRFTDWSRRPLSKAQLEYAMADVTHLRDLYPIMLERLEKKGREGWLAEEMKVLTNPATYRLDPEESWRRMKLRKTTTKWLAALRAAAAWRETEAQTRDMPRQRVMKDDAIYEIASVAPTAPEQLQGLRAVPKGFERSAPARRLFEKMSGALADAESYAPQAEKPAPPPQGIGPTVELLKVLLKFVAEDAGVATRLIATVPDLEKIASSDNPDVEAMKGWRREVFGEPALRLKRGELSLTLQEGKVVVSEIKPPPR
ncbi:ribonuclease D [Maricaulis sp.]|uniref:ribonuclease D n=1 Tax=Maricaulis sp. TaxID=1486257 RepID=UPI00261491EF|nr:ribonuclease D [Maricaulis sp.]